MAAEYVKSDNPESHKIDNFIFNFLDITKIYNCATTFFFLSILEIKLLSKNRLKGWKISEKI